MNLLVVGLSHHSAPIDALERVAFTESEGRAAVDRLVDSGAVAEAVVLSTCNRVEVYAAAPTFHGALVAIVDELKQRWEDMDFASIGFARHGQDAVDHLFRTIAGLDSIAAGESQILGQIRASYERAVEWGQVEKHLHDLFQRALHAGKRVRAETDIEAAAPSIIASALTFAEERLDVSVESSRVTVLGAGAMGALAAATVARREPGALTVVNRDSDKARRLAAEWGGRAEEWSELARVFKETDVLITATGAHEPVVTAELVSGLERLTVLDVALPRDTDPEAALLPGIEVVDLERLRRAAGDTPMRGAFAEAESIVRAEREEYLERVRAEAITPTVAALRNAAEEIVSAELCKLARRDDFSDPQRATVAAMVRRVVGRLLHEPTVRIRQLAGQPGAPDYAQILNELFALDSGDLGTATQDVLAEALTIRPDASETPGAPGSTAPAPEGDR
ncbi:glutamyl-tRNA reductase [Salininema proteolyticum]|uniref:Glutamyl-tRNA reductase n=1 Tax=Salininema proteolyticum TaxID=1607685 RepID=A0ABV8U3P7_9ACTN